MFLALVSGAMAFSSTLAWFKDGIDITMGDNGDINLVGGVELAYFGGGTGTVDDPFVISNRNHLYNLAWLQYLGKYNTNDYSLTNPTKSIQEKYFVITADIDMSGMVLPPIGTETYPFFGHLYSNKTDSNGEFTGQTCTVSNLTVSNDDPRLTNSDFGVNKPKKIADFTHAFKLNGNDQLTRVVGFMGVVGKIPTNTTITTQEVSGITPSLEDVVLDNLVIQSGTHEGTPGQLLIGLAAGYMDGAMDGVKVAGKSSFKSNGQTFLSNAITTNLSNYGLVGYTPEARTKYAGDISHQITEYYDSTLDPQGNDNLWGGSLDMQSLYTRLKGVEGNNTSNDAPHDYMTTKKYVDKNGDGLYTGDGEEYPVVAEGRDGYPAQEIYNRRSYNTGTGNNADYRGNYNFVRAESNPDEKIYMVGGTYQTTEYFGTSTGYNITDGNGNFLTNKCTNSTNGDDLDTKWKIDTSTKKIYSYDYASRKYVYLVALTASNNIERITITYDSNSATQFTISTSNNVLSIVHGSYKLAYISTNNFGWALYRNQNTTYTNVPIRTVYTTSSNNYVGTAVINAEYLDTNSANNQANAAQVVFLTYADGEKAAFRAINGNTVYYMRGTYRSGDSYRIYLTTDPAAANMCYYKSGNNEYIRTNIKIRKSGEYAFLRYNNGWRAAGSSTATQYAIKTVTTTVTGSNTAINVSGTTYNLPYNSTASAAADISTGNKSGKMVFSAEDTSYFPIKAALTNGETEVIGQNSEGQDITTTRNLYEALGNNCGYFVGGTTGYDYFSINSSQRTLAGLRSITMAQNTASSVISGSFTYDRTTPANSVLDVSKIKTIKTQNGSNQTVNITRTEYTKFGASHSRLQNVLALGENNVYGLHFLNYGGYGVISQNNVVRAKNIRLSEMDSQGNTYIGEYPEYDLPVYSADFKLHEQGYINFFAGNYDSSGAATNCFFSLHRVYREDSTDSSKITRIREIAGIYKPSSGWVKGDPYIYAYKGANNTVEDESGQSFNTNNKTLLFDTSWIGNNETAMSSYAKYIYYFEIPVDGGEYALGAVAGATKGAYLLYLDIGANGKAIKDEIYSYSVITTKKDINFPIGVDFDVSTATGTGGGSLCVRLDSGKNGKVEFAVATTTNTITVSGDTETVNTNTYSISEESFHNQLVVVVGGSGGAPPKPNSTVPTRTRTTYITVVVTDQSDITKKTTHYFKLVNNVNENGVVINSSGSVVYDSNGNNVTGTTPYVGDTEIYVGTKSGNTITWSSIGYDTTTTGLISRVPSLADEGILDILRTSGVLITLTKVSVLGDFDISLADMPWTIVTPQTGDPYFVYAITIIADNGMQYTITYVSGTHVTVDGTSPTSGSTITK